MVYRTINKAFELLKTQYDEGTCLSPYIIRKLANDNKISYVKSGTKILVEVGSLVRFLNGETFTPCITVL